MEHQGRNESNYFMNDGWIPDSPRPPSELLHLNQACVQDLICDLTDAHASAFRHSHEGALEVRGTKVAQFSNLKRIRFV